MTRTASPIRNTFAEACALWGTRRVVAESLGVLGGLATVFVVLGLAVAVLP